MLGGGDPVRVDRLHVSGVWLAAPANHEPFDDRVRLVDLALWHHRAALAAGRLGDERQGHDRGAPEVLAHLLGVDVEHWPKTPCRGELRQGALDVDPDVTGVNRELERLGGR